MTRTAIILVAALALTGCASAALLPPSANEVIFEGGKEGKTGWAAFREEAKFKGVNRLQVVQAAKAGLGEAGFALRSVDNSKGRVVGEHGMTLHDWNIIAGIYMKEKGNDTLVVVFVEASKDIGFSGDVTGDAWSGKILNGMRDYLKSKLKKERKAEPRKVARKPKPSPKTGTAGSGFFISKAGHVITNQHVVSKCKRVTVGDNARKQVAADILETDRSNDLALLKISSAKMASAETKSLMQKLGIKIVPLASKGLMRSEDVELGERVLVAGYPYGEIFSSTIKVTGGMVSAMRGLGDDSSQFQMDAAVQPGSSGGPIYDGNGNIVGVVIAQLNKLKFAKMTGSMPENVNFGIKASTVRQFLKTSGLPTKWSRRSKPMTTKELAKIAKSQTVMVMCHR
jgi:S1-C subfamily serine protease